jgi:hypothetical protein
MLKDVDVDDPNQTQNPSVAKEDITSGDTIDNE